MTSTTGRWFAACGNDALAVVEDLLASNALDPETKDPDGRTGLEVAIANGSHSVLQYLFRYFMRSGRSDALLRRMSDGDTPLQMAYKSGRLDPAAGLLRTYAIDYNATDSNGYSVWHLACRDGDAHFAAELIQFGQSNGEYVLLELVTANEDQMTGLALACLQGHGEIVRLIMASRDDINLQPRDSNGATPFFLLCQRDGQLARQQPLDQHAFNANRALIHLFLQQRDRVDPSLANSGGIVPNTVCSPQTKSYIDRKIRYYATQHEQYLLDPNSITFAQPARSLGSGGFGEVFLATWNGIQVAVKKVHSNIADARAELALRKEVNIWADLSDPGDSGHVGYPYSGC
jgi:hypothetical protein